ncbi:hypothetical protein B4064_1604 [Caldibacillus thermoamylovorans]|uniref:Serine protease n=1 Tax=Caldibacillus thermoamylovorans TaxID=35841 RepID=A0A090KSR3_9BACI|nr:CAP-associated domain-containing protein [Caldibacillus thermoamylovorans]KIO68820.1 hypothetical protein B4064_1604 [Caldibacillus thermoamylovorans]KIO69657.1 hypothetical protein B4166_1777 [Caldibacillus thermoamylovorans]KIO72894.1 hypothetical protein B4167_2670 [Caldibacillus thermoamylovorans]CEE01739.1 hypothetical protein BT1A1_1917 [Caldibacillus thermoamylovorans]
MRVILIIAALVLLFSFTNNADQETNSFIDQLKEGISDLTDQINLSEIKEDINDIIYGITDSINEMTEDDPKNNDKAEEITLNAPEQQTFSIANIELGSSKQDVENMYGQPKRVSLNEYHTNWHTYHENYQNFFMVAYNKDGKVAGLFTNQNLISSANGIGIGTGKEEVLSKMGTEPLTSIQKGVVRYNLPEDREYDIFHKDNSYITIFYDIHENNTVTAIQIISESLENDRAYLYTDESQALKEGFEYQLFDLTNAERVKHNLSPLTWDERVRITARKHSDDMAANAYFSHTNPKGQDPFDRMAADQITFILAGENLAYGQFSSIFAHEGLLNSLGHRKNILEKDYEYLGVGVAFNTNAEPYYTENFYAK